MVAALIAAGILLYAVAVLGLCRAAANGDRYLADIDEDDPCAYCRDLRFGVSLVNAEHHAAHHGFLRAHGGGW